ncbi:MAG: glycine zipper 2TM domain-containing protein [Curvibacter lanceolatus]|jgi:uncharacterized protein YcfJ|uniref:glycine zipper 2TM domain-containing protein n=1 Tax=Curvibacter lanceolatus TaxID=86182 RepID=UPI000365CA56|nr:glycine zipper 2TM domain-containing protein [Curvibacter lanceolatus]MBV5296116.1 glycine zipper 2TM domain-containing protein [Curvibacter lanceolatus]
MNKHFVFGLALLSTAVMAGNASAQEMARVLSTTPIIQQVAVPQQVCTNQQVATPGGTSGAGAAMGAVAGGALGNAVGGGSGKAIATVLGVVGGAVLGNSIEGPSQPQVRNVQNCSTQTMYENRTVAYNVSYEYAGRQYTVQMPNDPGQYLPVQVSPVINGRVSHPSYPASGPQPVTAPVYNSTPQPYPAH